MGPLEATRENMRGMWTTSTPMPRMPIGRSRPGELQVESLWLCIYDSIILRLDSVAVLTHLSLEERGRAFCVDLDKLTLPYKYF